MEGFWDRNKQRVTIPRPPQNTSEKSHCKAYERTILSTHQTRVVSGPPRRVSSQAKETVMSKLESTICGKSIKHDNSGIGHNWKRIDASDIPADIREEIAAEIIDGKKQTCDCYTATNGLNYRW